MAELAVIGGGLTGAALVLALRREGQDQVTWYAADEGRAQEAGTAFLQLPPNATRVLQALGLRARFAEFGMTPQALLHRAVSNSFVWADLPLGGFVVDRFKAPFLCSSPTLLLDLLHAECAALPGARQLQRVRSVAADGTVQHADGTAHRYALVVLATGADAVLEPELQSSDPAPGNVSILYEGSLALRDLPAALAQPVLTRWSHPRFDLWTLPDAAQGQLLLQLRPAPDAGNASAAGATAAPAYPRPPDSASGTPQSPAADETALPDWAELPDWARGATWQGVHQQHNTAPDRWYQGQVVLCGNAAHRLPLSSPLGPALALEDAWVLSRLIEQNDGSLDAVGAEFERFRAVRSRQLQQRTMQERARWFAAAAPGRTLYRLRSLLSHRFLPEFAYQELDWLYGYDCVRGFR